MTKSTKFEGLNCDNGMPRSQNLEQTQNNVKSLMKAMGTDHKCERNMHTLANSASSSGGFHGSMSMFGGLGGSASLSGNFQSSSTALDDSMMEKGCGSFVTNTKRVFDSMRNINCTLHQSSSEVDATANANASILVKVVPPPETVRITDIDGNVRIIVNPINELAQLHEDKKDIRASLFLTDNKALHKILHEDMTETNKTIRKLTREQGTLNIFNSTMRVTSNAKVKVMTSNVNTIVQKLEQDVKEVIQTTAEQKIQEVAGKNAQTPNIKQLISQEVDNRKEDINAMMTQNLTSTKVRTEGSAKIVLEAPKSITIKNSTIDASAIIDLVGSAITSNSVDLGKRIARDVMTSAASSSTTSTKHAGQEDVIRAMGDANAKAIEAQSEGLTNLAEIGAGNMMKYMIAAVVVITVFSFVGSGEVKNAATNNNTNQGRPAATNNNTNQGRPAATNNNTNQGRPAATKKPIQRQQLNITTQQSTKINLQSRKIPIIVGKLVLLIALVFHSYVTGKFCYKLATGDVGSAFALMNPFGGSFFSIGSIFRVLNPVMPSEGLFESLFKLYFILCFVDFFVKFPLKMFPATWVIPGNPVSTVKFLTKI
jgi:hypothetical protein